jgi:hypothetical protein
MVFNVRAVFLLSLLCALVACGWFAAEPDRRARDLLQALIETPNEEKRLREIANLSDADSSCVFEADLPGAVALDFLRARFVMGAPLSYGAIATRETVPESREVTVEVRDTQASAMASRYAFRVDLARDESGQWRVRALALVR